MKKLVLVLAILLMCGVAQAANIPAMVDPVNSPEVWTTVVFSNESSTTLDAGDIVKWDIDNSTGDNKNYILGADSADTHLVAGVVYPADITAGNSGSIAIHGVVPVDVVGMGGGIAAGSPVCSSSTEGSAGLCSTASKAIGFATAAPSGGSVNVFVGGIGR